MPQALKGSNAHKKARIQRALESSRILREVIVVAGATPEQQLQGMYDLQFVGTTPSGDRIVTRVTGDRDPGYGSTAKMLAQAGISLRRDVDQGAIGGGFWTTATVFNSRFLARLQEHAGLTFSVLETQRGAKT